MGAGALCEDGPRDGSEVGETAVFLGYYGDTLLNPHDFRHCVDDGGKIENFRLPIGG